MKPEYPLPVVGALIVNSENKILLVKFSKDENMYHIPGGKVHWGETIEEAVKREVKEEVGLDVEFDKILFVQDGLFPKDLAGRDKHYIFLECICRANSSDVKIDNREIVDFIWINSKEALNLELDDYTRRFVEKYVES